MVNNIAANVLGATPELEGGAESDGTELIIYFKLPDYHCHSAFSNLFICFCCFFFFTESGFIEYKINPKISFASF